MSQIHGKMDVITLGGVFAVGDPPQEAEPKGYVITGIDLGGVMYRPEGKPFVIEADGPPQPIMAFEYAEQSVYEELHHERRPL
jgi:hypothetical protein